MGRGAAGTKVKAALVIVLSLAAGAAAAAECNPGRVDLRRPDGSALAHFSVEIADDDAERAVGLMNRPRMASGAGMLFVYDRPQPVSFWMENTLIPLDMIFVGADGVVRKVHSNAVPRDRTSIPGGEDIQFVLEINGGLAGRLGIAEGAQLRHPAVEADGAAWACE
jgi:uncharacterized membrane protein (UPF0127 family)